MKRNLPSGTHEANRATSRRERRMDAESERGRDRDSAGWTRSVARSLGESLEQFDVADTLEELRHNIDDLIRRLADHDEASERRPPVRQPAAVSEDIEGQIGSLGRKVEAASDLLAELTDLLEAQTERIETIEHQLGDPEESFRPEPDRGAFNTETHQEAGTRSRMRRDAAAWPAQPLAQAIPRPELTAPRAPMVESMASMLVQRASDAPAPADAAPSPAEPPETSEIPRFSMQPPSGAEGGGLDALVGFLEERFDRVQGQLLRLEDRVEEFRALTGERDRQIRDLEERLLILVDGWHREDEIQAGQHTQSAASSTVSETPWPSRGESRSKESQGLHSSEGLSVERKGGRSVPGPKAHLSPALEVHARTSCEQAPEPAPASGDPGAEQRGRLVTGGRRRGRKPRRTEKDVVGAAPQPTAEPALPVARSPRLERARMEQEVVAGAGTEGGGFATVAGPARGAFAVSAADADSEAGGERLRVRLNGQAAGEAEASPAAPVKPHRPVPRPLWRQLQDNSRPYPGRSDAGLAQAAARLRAPAGEERGLGPTSAGPVAERGSAVQEAVPTLGAGAASSGISRRAAATSDGLTPKPVRRRAPNGQGASRLEEIVEREVRARRDFPAPGGASASDLVLGRKVRPVVMVVDDVADARTVLSLYLSKTGYHVVTAASAEDCLAKLRHHEVDAIILDARMPGASGAHVCEVLREDPAFANSRNVPIIVYTAHPDEYPRELVDRWRVAEYVVKGGDMLPLITALVRHTKIPEDRAQ
jgi:CheY-like chemotaxis protein